uniref:SCO-spondin isoform X4 n=1 Tax=Doryrhamphus excisus TaxID=161450 RepID=UPI0025AE4146|nr:SCO-spondin isoform X4 [Doryrhamphus excisus]
MDGSLLLCPPGRHSPEGVLHCLPCPMDSICTFGFAHKCGPGEEPNSDHTECNVCPPGFYSSVCTIHCLQCPAGNYCPESGTSQPLTCPPGWYSTPGQTSCQRCNDTSLLCGAAPRWRSSQPIACGPGTYKHTREDSACIACPVGHYCEGGVAIPCPAGTYGPKEGLTDCTVCPAGFYCLEGSSTQLLCAPGYYCEEGTTTPHGSPCPAGTAGEQLGQTSRAACKRCSEGRFCPAGSSSPGLPCARGRFCPAGTLEEVTCPPGTFTPNQGAISLRDCLKCPAGFYCLEGTSDPVPCPPGSFNPLEGQAESADCRECHAGKACTQVALRAPDVDCMQGFVCPPGSSKPNAQINACPPGTLSNRTDLTDRSQCQQCPARYACLRGTGGVQRAPLSCSAGHYCPPGTKFPTQYKCPEGTWSGQSGLESESECQPCPQGWYCLVGSGSPSGRCSSGHYCPEGTAYGTQFPCPTGMYSLHMGNRQKEDCLACPEGSFCPEGTSKPAPCPPSTFRHLKGGQRLEDCFDCPAGYFCAHSSTVNPRACGAGSYSDEGSAECSPCLPGHFCSNETTSEEAMLSVMVCPPGFLCSQGSARDPRRSATLCPRGFYCPGGGIDPNPVPCPNGTYSEYPALRDVSECVPCPKGKYCYSQQPEERPITMPTGLCPDGHYCPLGTGYPYSYPCLAGQYRSNAAGHSGEVCVSCPFRHYCGKPGVHTPAVCPQGFYCPEGSSSAQPCPEGSFGSHSALGDEAECSPCGGGRYCTGVGLAEPTGICEGRFYCREGSKFATPVDGNTGGFCPPGSYCPPASSSPFPCPPGTFSNVSGLSRPEDCVRCPPGLYCLGSNNTSPSGRCSPGYYCTSGSASPTQNEAEQGHYTLGGASRPEPCPLGTFQPDQGATSCIACQGGRLCNQTGLSQPLLCPKGHYCPLASSVAHPCPPGLYSDQPGGEDVQHCRACEAGWFCSKAGLPAPEGLCDAGHYCTSGASTAVPVALNSGGMCPAGYVCPRGTKHPQQHPCPLGTWSNTVGAQNVSFCLLCPAGLYCNTTGLIQPSGLCYTGFYCSGGAVSPKPLDGITGDICPVGHHCPMGSASPTLCPDGMSTNTTGAETCYECPPGSYCLPGEGIQRCPLGHYCLGGGGEGILPCPPGTYNPQLGLSQVEQCLVCPAGFYCEDWGLPEPTGPCNAGFYCIAGVNAPTPDGNYSTGVGGACPEGRLCPEGTGLPLTCPPGTYSDRLRLTELSGCSLCPAGHFCATEGLRRPSGKCQQGFYCPGGDTAATGSVGGLCPTAHYCPEGSASPGPCPAGSYANLTGQSVCSPCPAGYYCPEKTSDFRQFPCPPGFYCPDGTRHATQYPCPRGYYNPELMTQSLDSCLPCPPGHYCEKERLTKVSGKCKAATATGGRCQAGFYCPGGSSEPLPCLPGAFCNISGLALPMGPCSPGYYCVGGATEAKPTDGETGSICPSGTYCVEGSREPELCPPGTFSPVPGLTSKADCQRCPAGFYCRGPGLSAPSGPCDQGYWCPPGQTVAQALPCPLGHFCLMGSAAPEPCPFGTYQDREKQSACVACEAGYFCDIQLAGANGSLKRPCPKGHYCPAGARMPELHPCPVGSYNPRQHADSLLACMPCPSGQFCPSPGLSQPAGPCLAGYWCKAGASSLTPLDGLSGSMCPPGHYCPAGTTAPSACPKGTWSNSSGLRRQEDCQSCHGGFYCDAAGLTAPTGRCSGGYYCLGGAVTPTPTDGITGGSCPEGSYCPEGTTEPIRCDPGTYVAMTHATECEACPPGWYCVTGSLHLCPAGFYCPERTGYDVRSCPQGTYGSDPGYWSVSQCKQCDSGHYCSSTNATAVSGACQEGYYCSRGNTSPRPVSQAAAGEGGPCPVGHFCPPGSVHPLPCPPGTFSNLTKLVSQVGCELCLPGYYCDTAGLSAPSGKCRGGFFCPGGAYRPDPRPCPKGYYCSEGSAVPQPCPRGTISGEDGQASCSTCPQGFYCPESSNGSLYECPVGHFCPVGTWSKYLYSCPAGSINPHTRMAKAQDCVPCPPGLFCAFPGMSVASGQCLAGYYCQSGAQSPTPADGGVTGDLCPEGHYCPQGSSAPLPCPLGHYSNKTRNREISDCVPCTPGFLCATRGLSFPSHLCSAGSYCPSSNTSLLCPPGSMCPPGSHRPVPCLPGTYQNEPGQAECVTCPAGFYCAGSMDDDDDRKKPGIQTPTLCPQGNYCPPGSQSGVAFPCPAGTFSRQMGLSSEWGCEPCPPGTYCASSGLTAPTGLCSPGYFCAHRSVTAQPQGDPTGGHCPAGSYCPRGSGSRVPCPAGTFSSVEGATSVEECLLCLPGHYCAKAGLSAPSGPCKSGFYCTEGSTTDMPWGNNTGGSTSSMPLPGESTPGQTHGDMCPAGHYCPEGSTMPSPCPPGTFQGKSGAESEADCEACYAGSYCPSWAQTSVDLRCPAGWFCPMGSVSGHRPGFQCPPGHSCPYGSAEPAICGPGSFQSSSGQSVCNICPPGFYCVERSSEPSPCPIGTVVSSSGRTSSSECAPCPSGFFCNSTALTEPSGPCSPGYFCSSGSPEPSPVSQPHGDICPAGHFCPLGSQSTKPCPIGSFLPEPGASSPSHCHPCPPGKYCVSPGASQPTGLCSAGFFCTGGADNPTPQANPLLLMCLHEILDIYYPKKDNVSWLYNMSCFYNSCNAEGDSKWVKVEAPPRHSDSDLHIMTHSPQRLKSPHNGTCATYRGDLCPKGFYCPLGSAYPRQCETGSSCNQTGLEAPSEPCPAGYYCPSTSQDPHAHLCPAGHYCPLGTPLPVPCPLGTFQSSRGGPSRESCQPCPLGHYCHQRGLTQASGQCAGGYYCPPGQSSERPPQHICSVGHYCEKGSMEPKPCPPGSFQRMQGRDSCMTCPAGFYCSDQGTSSPRLCERGFYCQSASSHQRPCPEGFYGNLTGLVEDRQCSLCDPGMFCRGSGRTFPSGPCAAGYVCVGGASEPSPVDNQTGFLCPAGFFCSVGTFVPRPCPKGTFSERTGLVDESQCRSCSPGFYCSEAGLSAVSGPCLPGFYCLDGSQTAAPISSVAGGVCPAGYYCAEGSSVPLPCPAGSFRNETGGKGKDDCKTCPPGFYQDLSGQTECSRCPAGFHCETHRWSSTRGSFSGLSSPLPCPAGFFCPRERADGRPVPCPRGTYGPSQGLTSEGECSVCPAGHFCGSEGLVEPSGRCTAGYLCLAGASVPNPTDNSSGSLCPPGVFCQQGLKAGACREGFYCGWGSGRVDETVCPAGFFCPGGTPTPIPCPAGAFSSRAGNSHLSNCTECTAGYYCQVEGTVQLTLCPTGYYCPPGMTQGQGFPCPAGTVQNQLGASSLDACLPCPAGMFCSQPGLSQPTGPCESGYYCPAGSTGSNSSEFQSNSTKSHLCPSGHYCPAGTKNPIPCPAGSLSISRGLKRVEDCPPCRPGRFCDKPGSTELSDAIPCHAGYVCLGGSPSPTPSDGSHGYQCPAGYSCPVGSARALPCEPGTYNPAPGASECIVCPRGMMCSFPATLEPALCTLGHFCPVGTALPQPCPLGTFNNQTGAHSRSVCTACPPGLYCSTYGAPAPQGSCLQGYFCQGGAAGPAPQSTANFPKNGPCPAGHFCPAGCLAPIPCPLGSVRNSTGGVSLESCSTCPPGHYCATEGLSKPSGPCAAGFYCPLEFSSTAPYTLACPKGHYCPQGSAVALPCPAGEFQPQQGADRCIPCRPGFFCEDAIVGEPRLCPPHSFCPAGTMVPRPCPNGSYTDPNKGGLQEDKECLPCPPGRFCRAGRIQGACADGYLCLYGSAEMTPQGSIPDLTLCQWGVQCAGPCPPGFYCPEGTEKAILCPENTIRSYPGGASVQDCAACPPRHWCQPGEPEPRLCPAGHYCDGLPGSDINGWRGPKPCPVFTYGASTGAGSKDNCLPCPPGSHCNRTGLVDYTSTLCPPGFWCSGSGSPILCPAGTKRTLPGAADPSQCEPCAGGTFCPDPQATGQPNMEGIPCRASYECPSGSASEKLCRAGSYCQAQTAEPQICPAGYVCTEGSHSYNLPQQLCPYPYYCPPNSSSMKSCDGGLKPVKTTGLRGSKSLCCRVCEEGTYRPDLSAVVQCLSCPQGYFCPPGTDNYKSNPCPRGYVCPSGSVRPTPCPPGSFGNATHAEKLQDCHPCPADTFNHLHGHTACFPCGSSSTSTPGSSSCACIGKNRAFQHSDGSCLCRTGFIFYNELDFKSSASDSELDCQPEMNRRCAAGQVRLAASRECVSPSLHSCNVTCGPHGGTLDVEMGICHCQRYVSAEELCSTSCLSKMPQLSSHFSPDGHLILSVREKDGTVWTKTLLDIVGPDRHAQDIRKIHLVEFDSQGVFGWIPTQRQDIELFLSESLDISAATNRKRRSTGDPQELLLPRIPNPVACLSTGDMLIFRLTINHTDRNLSHFPVYDKDHLFNSNPSWDFGVFRRLQTLMKQSNLNNTWFAHVFSQTGKYAFMDSAVPHWSLVAVVSEDGTECDPRAATFQPMTPTQLVRFGVVTQHRLNLLPDWGVITGLLSLLLVLVVVVTTTVVVLWPSKAKLVCGQWRTKPKWRSLGDPPHPVCICTGDRLCAGSRGVAEGAEGEESVLSKGGMMSERFDLEEFNVKTLYDKLEDQNLHVASQLARHRKDTQEFYRNICQQVEALQHVFENMDGKKLSLLKEMLASQNAMRDNPYNSSEKRIYEQAGDSAAVLGVVLRSVEALLNKLNGSTWQARDLQPPRAREAPVRHAGVNTSDTSTTPALRDPSMDLTEMEAPGHSHGTEPHLSDVDLAKLVCITPLCKTLQEIQQPFQNFPTAPPGQTLPNVIGESSQENTDVRLIPSALDSLSPRHSAVFLFGCRVMELLEKCSSVFPSVLLMPAKSVPRWCCDNSLLSHCSGDFYFDASGQVLYLKEAKLEHIGHFIATILQSMAHVASSGLRAQSFMQVLHEAISALSLQLFNMSFTQSTAEHGALGEEFLNTSVPKAAHLTEQVLAARLEKYRYSILEQLIGRLGAKPPEDRETAYGTPAEVEEEIDRLNQAFLELSVQLQRSAHKEREDERASPPSLGRNGTILLELNRRSVSQRLNQLQITLDRIRQQQQVQ